MPSGWDVYYVIFLSATLALGMPLALALLSHVFSGRRKNEISHTPENLIQQGGPSRARIGRRLNTRFFLAANAALVLIGFALLLIPCVGTITQENSRDGIIRGLLAVVSISFFAALGLLYSAQKGDLSWLSTFSDSLENKNGEE